MQGYFIFSVLGSGHSNRYHGTYLLFVIKDRGLMGNGIFLGEALLPLEDVQRTDMDENLADLPQIILPLTRPSEHGKISPSKFYSPRIIN
jgi:hypothetical protein